MIEQLLKENSEGFLNKQILDSESEEKRRQLQAEEAERQGLAQADLLEKMRLEQIRLHEEELNRIKEEGNVTPVLPLGPPKEQIGLGEDDQMLQMCGDIKIQEVGRSVWVDHEWEGKQFGEDYEANHSTRSLDDIIKNDGEVSQVKVCTGNWNCNDVLQGGLGDCWFLSAISAVSHSNPELIGRLFHSSCRKEVPENGLFTLMFYEDGKPMIISIDNKLATPKDGCYTSFTDYLKEDGVAEVWPNIIEKAYAKFKGSYTIINGGYPEEGLADLTGGTGYRVSLSNDEGKEKVASGAMWEQIQNSLSEG